MSDDAAGTTLAEKGLASGEHDVASFEDTHHGPLRRIQGFLHSYPTAIPFIVLLIGVLIFTIAAGGRFFAPFNLSLVLQQVTG